MICEGLNTVLFLICLLFPLSARRMSEIQSMRKGRDIINNHKVKVGMLVAYGQEEYFVKANFEKTREPKTRSRRRYSKSNKWLLADAAEKEVIAYCSNFHPVTEVRCGLKVNIFLASEETHRLDILPPKTKNAQLSSFLD